MLKQFKTTDKKTRKIGSAVEPRLSTSWFVSEKCPM
jgi:hypothetical protein